MKKILIILLAPIGVLSQEVLIKPVSENINSINAEINFVQKTDSTAYFTTVKAEGNSLKSSLYKAVFLNGSWYKNRYSKYNSDVYNTGNIFFSEQKRVFLTRCNGEISDCNIIYFEESEGQEYKDIKAISAGGGVNTQPFVANHKTQRALYFVSDRKGGYGGLDIWISIIDKNGNFGIPINAGGSINSAKDEITPFYNHYNGMMYFSSNRDGSFGGFDIYKAEGRLNIWSEPKNVKELNSPQDDLYLTFYNIKRGYFSSNREGAKFQSTEYCCNDIFSFEYPSTEKLDTLTPQNSIQNYLPLSLYFHNDEPDPNTTRTTTTKTYKQAYISYFMKRPAYEKQNKKTSVFFEEVLLKNFNLLNMLLETLLQELKRGNKIELQIRGYASPLHNQNYNQSLSQRRISSLINYMEQYKNGPLKQYIFSKQLLITKLPLGENMASKKVSDDAKDKKKSVYSIGAMLERKIEIIDVILK